MARNFVSMMFVLLSFLVSMACAFTTPTFVVSQQRTTSLAATTATTVVSMSETLERESVRGPAVLDRPVVERDTDTERRSTQRRDQGHESWEVRIYNDGINTREHVARTLVQVTGLSEFNAYQTMMQAHQNGIAVVGRWVYEIAEMYQDGLRNNEIVCDIVPVDEDI